MSTFTTQEQIVINRGSRQSGPFCPACESPINEDYNQLRPMPVFLTGIKDSEVPPVLRGIKWNMDGCQACTDYVVHKFATYWLSQGPGSMEDVASLIADHYELDLPRKVTA